MNIFVVGLSSSGRTTVSKALSNDFKFIYIDPVSLIKDISRDFKIEEYEESCNEYLINRLKLDPDFYYRNINDLISSYNNGSSFVIDGILNPRDFIQLFNYNTDTVIFLNRIDNDFDCKDNQNIAISVIRDYCYWLASMKFLDKNRWLEFNFSIPGDSNNDSFKKMGTHSTIILVKSIKKVISFIKETITKS